jgi:hypothetical protein
VGNVPGFCNNVNELFISEPIFDDNTGIALLSFTVGSTGNPELEEGSETEGGTLAPGTVTAPSWFDKIESISANLDETTLAFITDVSTDVEGGTSAGEYDSTSAAEYESLEYAEGSGHGCTLDGLDIVNIYISRN